jgi:hypothetical protein
MKRNGNGETNGKWRRGKDGQQHLVSSWETDTPEFREQVQEAVRQKMGQRLDEFNLEPDIRELFYDVFATALRTPPKPIPKEILEQVELLRAAGLHVTPGHNDFSHRKPLRIPGFSLTEAVLEERYGADYVPPRRRRRKNEPTD